MSRILFSFVLVAACISIPAKSVAQSSQAEETKSVTQKYYDWQPVELKENTPTRLRNASNLRANSEYLKTRENSANKKQIPQVKPLEFGDKPRLQPRRSARVPFLVIQKELPRQSNNLQVVRFRVKNTGSATAYNVLLDVDSRDRNLVVSSIKVGLRKLNGNGSLKGILLGSIKAKQVKTVEISWKGDRYSAIGLNSSIRFDNSPRGQRSFDESIQLLVDGPATSKVGETITHTVLLVNRSRKTLSQMKLVARLPESFRSSVDSNTVTLNQLAPGEQRRFVFQASSTCPDVCRFEFKIVQGARTKSVFANHRVIHDDYELSFSYPSKSVSGSLQRYKFHITNRSSRKISDLIVRLRTTRNFKIEVVDRDAHVSEDGKEFEFQIPSLGPSETMTIKYLGIAKKSGSVKQSAEVIALGKRVAKSECQTQFRDPKVEMKFENPTEAIALGKPNTVFLNLRNREKTNLSGIELVVSLPPGIQQADSPGFRKVGNCLISQPLTLGAASNVRIPIRIRAGKLSSSAKMVAQIKNELSRQTAAQKVNLVFEGQSNGSARSAMFLNDQGSGIIR